MRKSLYFTKLPLDPAVQEYWAELRLWRSVIDQAIEDFRRNGKSSEDAIIKQAAKVWLRGRSKNFKDVCSWAGLDPYKTRDKIFDIVGGIDVLYR